MDNKIQQALQSRYLRLTTRNLTNTLSMLQPSGTHHWFDSKILQCASNIQVQYSDIVVLIQCSYSARTVLIQFTSRQAKARPKQRSQMRKIM